MGVIVPSGQAGDFGIHCRGVNLDARVHQNLAADPFNGVARAPAARLMGAIAGDVVECETVNMDLAHGEFPRECGYCRLCRHWRNKRTRPEEVPGHPQDDDDEEKFSSDYEFARYDLYRIDLAPPPHR